MLKLALIGRDVSQSSSPSIHAFITRRLGDGCVYDKISLGEEEFAEKIDGLLRRYDGMNVTIPYKLSVMPHLESIEGDAAAFGAVNTIVCSTRTGYNTDGLGFMQMLRTAGIEVGGKSALVLGAGGAGRSAVKKLLDGGARVYLYNRHYEKAEKVAAEFGNVTAIESLSPFPVDVIINATGVGMHETVGQSPVSADVIAQCGAAADLIYNPARSRFLCIAEELGKKIVNGASMLFYQAYYSDCYYLGVSPDPAQAEELYKEYLKEGKL